MRYHPEILGLLDQWFSAAGEKSRSHGDVVWQDMYKAMHQRLSSILVSSTLSAAEKLHLFARDWFIDSKGRPERYFLSRRQFCDAIYVMVDLWADGIERSKYARFLRGLLRHVLDVARIVKAKRKAGKIDPNDVDGAAVWGRVRAAWQHGGAAALAAFLKGVKSKNIVSGSVAVQPSAREGAEASLRPGSQDASPEDEDRMAQVASGHLQELSAAGFAVGDSHSDADSVSSVRSANNFSRVSHRRELSRDGAVLPMAVSLEMLLGSAKVPAVASPSRRQRREETSEDAFPLRVGDTPKVLPPSHGPHQAGSLRASKPAGSRPSAPAPLPRRSRRSVNMLSSFGSQQPRSQGFTPLLDDDESDAARARNAHSFIIPRWQSGGKVIPGEDSTVHVLPGGQGQHGPVEGDSDSAPEQGPVRGESGATSKARTESAREESQGGSLGSKHLLVDSKDRGSSATSRLAPSPVNREVSPSGARRRLIHGKRAMSRASTATSASASSTADAQPMMGSPSQDLFAGVDDEQAASQAVASRRKPRFRGRFRGTKAVEMADGGQSEEAEEDTALPSEEDGAVATPHAVQYDEHGARIRNLASQDAVRTRDTGGFGGEVPSDDDILLASSSGSSSSSVGSDGSDFAQQARQAALHGIRSGGKRGHHRRTSSVEAVQAAIARAANESGWSGLTRGFEGWGGDAGGEAVEWDFEQHEGHAGAAGSLLAGATHSRKASATLPSSPLHASPSPSKDDTRESFLVRMKRQQARLQEKARRRAAAAKHSDSAGALVRRTSRAAMLPTSHGSVMDKLLNGDAPDSGSVPAASTGGSLPWWASREALEDEALAVGAVGGSAEARRRVYSRGGRRVRDLEGPDAVVIPSYIVQPDIPDAVSVLSGVSSDDEVGEAVEALGALPWSIAVQSLSPAASALALALQHEGVPLPAADMKRLTTIALGLTAGGMLSLARLRALHVALLPTEEFAKGWVDQPLDPATIVAVHTANQQSALRPSSAGNLQAEGASAGEPTVPGIASGGPARTALEVVQRVLRRPASAPGALRRLASRYISFGAERGGSRGGSRGNFVKDENVGGGEDEETLAFLLMQSLAGSAQEPGTPPRPAHHESGGHPAPPRSPAEVVEQVLPLRVHIRPSGKGFARRTLAEWDAQRPKDATEEFELPRPMTGSRLLQEYRVPLEHEAVHPQGNMFGRSKQAADGTGESAGLLPWLESGSDAGLHMSKDDLQSTLHSAPAGGHSLVRQMERARQAAAEASGVGLDGHAPAWVRQRYRRAAPSDLHTSSTAYGRHPLPPGQAPHFHSSSRRERPLHSTHQPPQLRQSDFDAPPLAGTAEEFSSNTRQRLLQRLPSLERLVGGAGIGYHPATHSAREKDVRAAMGRRRHQNAAFDTSSGPAALAVPGGVNLSEDFGSEGIFTLGESPDSPAHLQAVDEQLRQFGTSAKARHVIVPLNGKSGATAASTVSVKDYPRDLLVGPSGESVTSLAGASGALDGIGALIVLAGQARSNGKTSVATTPSPYDFAELLMGGVPAPGGGFPGTHALKSVWLTEAVQHMLAASRDPSHAETTVDLRSALREFLSQALGDAAMGAHDQGLLVVVGHSLMKSMIAAAQEQARVRLSKHRMRTHPSVASMKSTASLSFGGDLYSSPSLSMGSRQRSTSPKAAHDAAWQSGVSLLLTGGVSQESLPKPTPPTVPWSQPPPLPLGSGPLMSIRSLQSVHRDKRSRRERAVRPPMYADSEGWKDAAGADHAQAAGRAGEAFQVQGGTSVLQSRGGRGKPLVSAGRKALSSKLLSP